MKKLLNILFVLLIGTSFAIAQETQNNANDGEGPEVLQSEPGTEVSPQYDNDTETSELKSDENGPMTIALMQEIVKRLDPEAKVLNDGRVMVMRIADVEITIISAPASNRMRAFAPVTSLDGVDSQKLYRMLQANFDSALDARYSIAKEHVISAYVHPLAELKQTQFIEGLGQVVNLVKTYGTAYTSGAMTFGGGDSRQLHRKLIDDLLEKGDTI